MSLSPRHRLVALATGGGLAFIADLIFATWWSGAVALAAMAVVVWSSSGGILITLARRGLRVGRSGLVRTEVGLTLALVGLLLARAWILYRALQDGDAVHVAAAARTYTGAFIGVGVLALTVFADTDRFAKLLLLLSERPARMLASSFALMIAIGTTLLSLPASVHRLSDVSLIDSLFTITSAVCVTGLTVNDVAATYTPFGLAVILVGIQLGGIGIMALAALALTASRDAGLEQQSLYCTMLEARNPADLRSMMRGIVSATLLVEAIGALLLYLAWRDHPATADRSVLWLSVFHAVSAFCNAGFALFPGNLAPFTSSIVVQLVIMVLIILGGLGFPVMRELYRQSRARLRRLHLPTAPRPPRLSLQTRVVLFMTTTLVLGGAWFFFILEHSQSLAALPPVDQIVGALFASVTTRTAGFSTVDFGAMREATLFGAMLLIFIGGSPGSTAGGIKTTTAATLGATLRAELRGRDPELFGRALPSDTIRRAFAVVAIGAAVVFTLTLALSLLERQPFVKLLFEAVSAFGTAGLSTGITPLFSAGGKLVLILGMFIGRVGPLTVALAVGAAGARRRHKLAAESLPIG